MEVAAVGSDLLVLAAEAVEALIAVGAHGVRLRRPLRVVSAGPVVGPPGVPSESALWRPLPPVSEWRVAEAYTWADWRYKPSSVC